MSDTTQINQMGLLLSDSSAGKMHWNTLTIWAGIKERFTYTSVR